MTSEEIASKKKKLRDKIELRRATLADIYEELAQADLKDRSDIRETANILEDAVRQLNKELETLRIKEGQVNG